MWGDAGNSVTLIAINGLAGYALAADKGLATPPVTAQVIGSALATIPASLVMQRIGRRAGFQIGGGFGLVGGAISTLAIALSNFWLLCFGTLILGVYGAFGLYYRFAAADSAGEEFKAKAISLVLTGGLAGVAIMFVCVAVALAGISVTHFWLAFGVTIVASFSSGLLLKSDGWQMLNYVAIPFLALAGLACLWMMLHTRKTIATA